MTVHRRAGPCCLARIVAALFVATVVASCGAPPPTPPPTPASPVPASGQASASPAAAASFGTPETSHPPESPAVAGLHGLLLLAGRPGSMGLELIGVRGERRPVPLPDPGVAWLSSSLDGRLLATTLEGHAYVSGPIMGEALPVWRPLAMVGVDVTGLAGQPAFGSLAPDGTMVAFVAADFESSRPSDIVIVPLDGSSGTVLRLSRPADGASPGWIDRRLVVLTRTPEDRVGSTIVDLGNGTQSDGPVPLGAPRPAGLTGWIEPIAGLSIAADGSSLAIASADDGRVEIHPAAAWTVSAETTPEPVKLEPERDGSRSFAWLAISDKGDRLAIVRTDDAGDSVAVTLYDRASGWGQGRRLALPVGANRAVVAWLP